jgi:hypothetical protein
MKKNKTEQFPVSKDALLTLLDNVVGNRSNFKGNDRFYKAVNINHKRWAKLMKGELSITIDELKNICDYINVEFSTETFARQLKLFKDDEVSGLPAMKCPPATRK